MSDLGRAAPLMLAALLCGARLPAQTPPGATPRERALLARVDSLYRQLEARRERLGQEHLERARGRLVESGDLAAVVPGQASPEQALRSLDSAAQMLRHFGALPDGFARSVVVVLSNATDTAGALSTPAVNGRRRLRLGGIQWTGVPGGGSTLTVPAQGLATAIASGYRDTRDADWRAWLPADLGVAPWSRAAAWGAFGLLARSEWEVGRRCLSGDAAGCRLWLGVDRDSAPYRDRYTAEELRSYVERHWKWSAQRSELGRACLGGTASACVEYVGEERHVVFPIPADEASRRGLIQAVRALHGAGALQRAFADTAGSVGQRFARAAGIGEDTLMREWRSWVLTRGGRPEERSLFADGAPALLLAGLFVLLARRGRP
jgi:hypothetical protein